MRKLYCRGCDGEGSFDISCSCHGRSTSYNCGRCGNCGQVEASCPVCNKTGNVSSWEEVKEGLLFKDGDMDFDDYDDGPDPDEAYDRMQEEKMGW